MKPKHAAVTFDEINDKCVFICAYIEEELHAVRIEIEYDADYHTYLVHFIMRDTDINILSIPLHDDLFIVHTKEDLAQYIMYEYRVVLEMQ